MDFESGWLTKVGVAVLAAVAAALVRYFLQRRREPVSSSTNQTTISINNTLSNLGTSSTASPETVSTQRSNGKDCRILFIDDDTKFQVVKIIKQAGYANVKIIKDIQHLDLPDVVDAQILFIDIQGVGKAMCFNDEGLGLALAIKKKYPDKRVVIYSAQTTGERFHEALRKADASLPKNAEPFEFLQLVEQWCQG